MTGNVALQITILCTSLAAEGGERFAFLRDGQIFVSSLGSSTLDHADKDPRQKGRLSWDARGKRFAYIVAPENKEMARLVVANLAGDKIAEVPIRPETDPPTQGFRYAEDISWTPAGKVRVSGSINPSNCEAFDLDIVSGHELRGMGGKCGSFQDSPDGKHIASLGMIQ